MQKLIKDFKYVLPGEIYPTLVKKGEDCPRGYEAAARRWGCLPSDEDNEQPVAETDLNLEADEQPVAESDLNPEVDEQPAPEVDLNPEADEQPVAESDLNPEVDEQPAPEVDLNPEADEQPVAETDSNPEADEHFADGLPEQKQLSTKGGKKGGKK